VSAPLQSDLERPLQLYAWGYDEGEWDLMAEAFAEDGELVTEQDPLVGDGRDTGTKGREAIIERFKQTRQTFLDRGEIPRHVTTNVLVERVEGDEAWVRCYYIMSVQRRDALHTLGISRYYDHLVNDGGVWRIKRRRNVAVHQPAFQKLLGTG
jgi:3-phenylpropionate/cinnamic acid dioxygenase small subunit